jgi:hypothetical protein
MACESEKYLDAIMRDTSPETPRWPMEQLKGLFFGSETTWLNQHGLMLLTDFWGNYERADKLLRPDRPLRNKKL